MGLAGAVLVALMSCLVPPAACQPATPDGFWYGAAAVKDTAVIEAFFDPVCPDSRDSWPPLKKAVREYGSRVSLVVHTFPLPYHDNAFLTSRALHVVDKLNTTSTYPLLESFFKNQEQFYSKATYNLSRAEVVEKVEKFVAKEVGGKYGPAIKTGLNDTKTDQATRFAFKTGCLRGVYGTPFFFVNGFPLPDAGSAIDYKGWKKVLEPLIKQEKSFQTSPV
ncbi:uncharacterized protein LOC127256936 [Andrographis paniculata]|uniref:uncharacterized protein LOC127256936 n=1 Tax=Andrographis paniculata TaxID=175694 RepID=UPI0021E84FFB|nr:uncharacterized protein LOC127256936 [Andrographis paniculata]